MKRTIILLLLITVLFVSGCVFSEPQITEIQPLSLSEYSWKTIDNSGGEYTATLDDGRVVDVTGAEYVNYLELIIYNPNPFDVFPTIEGMDMIFKSGQIMFDKSVFVIKPGENRITIQERNNNLTKYIIFTSDNKATLTFTAVGIGCSPTEGCKMDMGKMNDELKKYGGRVVLRKVIDLPTLKNTSITRRFWS